jgi:hypothetical protein
MEKPKIFIHGNASEDLKEEKIVNIKESYAKGYSAELSQEDVNELLKAEIEKTSVDIETINLANTITNDLLVEYGLKPFDLKENNVHIIGEDIYKKFAGGLKNMNACYSSVNQAIFVKHSENEPNMENVGKILHEAIHFKGYQSDQIFEFFDKDSKNPKDRIIYSGLFREGLKVASNMRRIEENDEPFSVKFKGLNEAVVVELEKKLLPVLISSSQNIPKEPYMDFEEKAKVASEAGIDPSEIEFIYPSEKMLSYYIYPNEREVLNFVVDSILQDDSSLTKDEVMEKFFLAHFSGNILEIGRLIENSFGKGSFRILSDMGIDHESYEKVKQILIEKRLAKS